MNEGAHLVKVKTNLMASEEITKKERRGVGEILSTQWFSELQTALYAATGY